ncbi:MAG: HEAT repeat domain-containing protein [Elusimicrobia bacterium]|nr:HEAT repeat domain-containing protein [Elusimicrobiota bacterium]
MLLLAAGPAFLAISAQAAKPAVSKSTAAARAELGREAVAMLSSSGADPDPEVRAVVAAAWGDLKNRAAIPFLKRALTDANADVRIAAAASLYRLGEVDGLTNLIDETKTAGGAPPTTPAQELRRMARDAARARAVLKLGEVAGSNARAALDSAHKDPEGEVRDAAAVALARLGTPGASAPFLSAVADADEAVRASAARSLGLIGREGRGILAKLAATDVSVSVRAEACAALGVFSDPGDVPVLAAALGDKSGRVRLAAVRALARRHAADSTAALKSFLDKAPAPEFALTAQAGLAERGEDVELGLADLTLGQDDPELKSLAVRVLSAARRAEALDLLAKAMRGDPSRRIQVEAAAGVIVRLRRVESPR